MPIEDYSTAPSGSNVVVFRRGELVGWMSQVRSDGRSMWGFSPAVPARAHDEPPGPCASAAEMLAAWVAYVEGGG